jgi:phospholipase/carboxylesterase
MKERLQTYAARLALALCVCGAVLCTERTPVEGKEPPSGLAHVERVTGGADAAAKLPLVVAIHGLGDTPEAFMSLYDGFEGKARIVAPRAPDAYGPGGSWYPFREANARKLPVIRARADLLARFIGELRDKRPSAGRTIVTGFSQGGVMSFALAAYHPELLAAALPIAGMFDPSMPEPVAIKSPLPVIAFHGRADDLVTHAEGERAVERLRKAGRKVTLNSYDGVGHSIPPVVQRDYFAALRDAVERAAHK